MSTTQGEPLPSIEALSTHTYASARRWLDAVPSSEAVDALWDHYCYLFRDGCYRYSDIGKHEAARHAKRNDLTPPLSDRPPAPGLE